MSLSRVNLRSMLSFPSFRELPKDDNLDDIYYGFSALRGTWRPCRHWVFLAEIVEDLTFRLPDGVPLVSMFRSGDLGIQRPRFSVRDRAGDEHIVAYHIERLELPAFEKKKHAVGHTLAVYYANGHDFMDFTSGLRIEAMTNIKVIPCSLETLLNADPVANEEATSCTRCGISKGKLLACAKCRSKYCSKECQMQDWPMHKPACAATRQVQEWGERKWDEFESFWQT